MTRRTYTGPIVDVSYDGEVCQHAAECIRGMPTVFNLKQRPWIDPGHADTEGRAQNLRDVIALSPSGALEVVEHQEPLQS